MPHEFGIDENVCKSLFLGKHGEQTKKEQILLYCQQNSTQLHPVLKRLYEETVETQEEYVMLGAPEVLQMNVAFIKAMGAKKILDVGVFTGASALASALAIPDDGRVVACDIDTDYMKVARGYWEQAGIGHKVRDVVGLASDTLQALIDRGDEAGTWDFAFVDANKPDYPTYYRQLLVLLKRGGVVALDNTLWKGKVFDPEITDEDTESIRRMNKLIKKDSEKHFCVQLNIGDGYTVVVKQ